MSALKLLHIRLQVLVPRQHSVDELLVVRRVQPRKHRRAPSRRHAGEQELPSAVAVRLVCHVKIGVEYIFEPPNHHVFSNILLKKPQLCSPIWGVGGLRRVVVLDVEGSTDVVYTNEGGE